MANNKFLRISVVGLCAIIFVSTFLLDLYNDGREWVDRDNCHELARCTYYMDYYSRTFSFDNIDIIEEVKSHLFCGVVLMLPWLVWALRKKGFTMTWWRWGLLLSDLSLISFRIYGETWKLTHIGWYDIESGYGPAWWVAFERISYLGASVCLIFFIIWLIYKLAKGIMYIVKHLKPLSK